MVNRQGNAAVGFAGLAIGAAIAVSQADLLS